MKYYKKKLPNELEDLIYKHLHTSYMRDLIIELKEEWFDLYHNNYCPCNEDYISDDIDNYNEYIYGKNIVYASPFLSCDYEDYNTFFNNSSGTVRPGYFGNYNKDQLNNNEETLIDAICNIFENKSSFLQYLDSN